jgi:hypothetical protein
MGKFDEEKTLAAILYLADQDGEIDLYALLKTLYYADKNHLHEWGRTITGDTYVRMGLGPVPSNTYDMLKSVRGDGDWIRDLKQFLSVVRKTTVKPLCAPDMNSLSETDKKALEASFKIRGRKGFNALKKEAHDDRAFQESDNWIMTEEDLAEKDPLLLQHIKDVKGNEQFLKAYRYLPSEDEEGVCT